MTPNHHFRGLIAEDTPAGNDGDVPGFAQPVSQAEIEELHLIQRSSEKD